MRAVTQAARDILGKAAQWQHLSDTMPKVGDKSRHGWVVVRTLDITEHFADQPRKDREWCVWLQHPTDGQFRQWITQEAHA